MSTCVVPLPALHDWAMAVLESAGASHTAAGAVADGLVDANRRGLDSHGVSQLFFYLPSLAAGATRGSAEPSVVVETPAMALVDGHDGLGHYVAHFAMGLCCKKAKQYGTAIVGVRNSSHFGAASCYAEQAARLGCIGVALSNSDPGMAPFGTLRPVIGTNPVAIAAPRGGRPPVSLDFATSVVAQSRVINAARARTEIPGGWAIGPDGAGTTDPKAALAGAMLPMSGYKGFGLALMIDVLCGCLTGSALSPDIPNDPVRPEPQRTGHLFMALEVEHFREASQYLSALERLEQAVHDAPRSVDAPALLLPGDIEATVARERESRGVPFDEASTQLLGELGREYGVAFPV